MWENKNKCRWPILLAISVPNFVVNAKRTILVQLIVEDVTCFFGTQWAT